MNIIEILMPMYIEERINKVLKRQKNLKMQDTQLVNIYKQIRQKKLFLQEMLLKQSISQLDHGVNLL